MEASLVLITDRRACASQPLGEQSHGANPNCCKQNCQHENEFSSRSASGGLTAELRCLSHKYRRFAAGVVSAQDRTRRKNKDARPMAGRGGEAVSNEPDYLLSR